MKRALILALIAGKIYGSSDVADHFKVAHKVIESQAFVVCIGKGPCWSLKPSLEDYLKSKQKCLSMYPNGDQAYKNCINGCGSVLNDAVALAAARAKK